RLSPRTACFFPITRSLRGESSPVVPGCGGFSPIPYVGSAYLGPAHEPFAISGDPNDPHFEVPNIGLKSRQEVRQLDERMHLRQRMDQVRHYGDQADKLNVFDSFQSQAWNLVTGPQARKAFDIGLEARKIRT